MVKKIMRDPLFFAQRSTDATEADRQVITDLLDTLRANLDHCVGMAANMIGVKKNIIVVAAGPFQFAMVNPVITKKTGAFQTEEGCLSLEGVRPCTRYKEIEVDFLDADFKKQHGKYSGWTAQIIQHEIDHCNWSCNMKPKSPKSLELYDIMIKRGYPAEFCDQITKNLNTDWTAGRMMGYLSHYKKLPLEEIVDEMLAILSDRNRIMQKHEMEEINARWNGYLNG